MTYKEEVILRTEDLHKDFFLERGQSLFSKKNKVSAVNGVSIDIFKNETYGLVGESGCGKSTLARLIMDLIEPSSGKIIYQGEELRRNIQMVFQDPFSSLNPKKRIGSMLKEPLDIHKIGKPKERQDRVFEILEKVGLSPYHYYSYPREFSGGQRQRLNLARAIISNPRIIVCDEPVSALDVSIQAQIINLLKNLQKEFALTYLVISHDISVVRYISDRVGVMYLGKIVEEAPVDEIFNNPLHPYTKILFSSVSRIGETYGKTDIKLRGELPSPMNIPKGCAFHTRCPYVMEVCKKKTPQLFEAGNIHKVACFLVNDD